MKVSKLLKLHGMLVLTVHPDFTLAEASRRFVKPVGGRRFSLAIVTSYDDEVMGVISLGDIAAALGKHEEKAVQMRVKDVMTKDVLTCSLDDDLEGSCCKWPTRGSATCPWSRTANLRDWWHAVTRWSSFTSKRHWTQPI
ncbi:MAG: CBS domain-containing protein [Defluviicoccus sp.]|nr:MAG: CBS domain-containing protein [Defluviicoccus sp.]